MRNVQVSIWIFYLLLVDEGKASWCKPFTFSLKRKKPTLFGFFPFTFFVEGKEAKNRESKDFLRLFYLLVVLLFVYV